MNSKQRVDIAISGGAPDRVPVVPKIWVDFAANLLEAPLDEIITDPQAVLKVLIDAGKKLELDAVRQFHFPKRKVEKDEKGVFETDKNGKRIGRIDMDGGLVTNLFDQSDYSVEDPFMMAHHHFWATDKPIIESIEDTKRITIPDKSFLKEIGWLDRQQKMIDYAGDDIALFGDCSSATLAFYICMRGMDAAMYDLIESPELVHSTMEKGVEIAIEKGKFHLDMGLNIIRLNDSVANMSVISPQHFREFVKPHIKDVCSELHKYSSDAKIYCHICGNVMPIIEDILDTGLDCIAPLDPLGGVTCKQVRDYVGSDVSLMGGVNTLSFVDSTVDEIMKESRICIEGAGMEGGFILGSGCVVPRTSRPENVSALVAASKEYGAYEDGKLD